MWVKIVEGVRETFVPVPFINFSVPERWLVQGRPAATP